jgi:probable rRNA maturation factor
MVLPEGLILEVSVDFEDWNSKLSDYNKIIINVIYQIVKYVPEGKQLSKFQHLELGIILCDDTFIRHLNKTFRNRDDVTNVLSFEGLSPDQSKAMLQTDAPAQPFPQSLGEVYIAYETLKREAELANITFSDHFTHLTIHGILHLLGYDHIENHEAEIMEAIETKLLNNLAIDDPYAA